MVSLSNISSSLLPPTITGPIFEQATEESAVMRLARRVPLSMTAQTAIPVSMDIPAAGWVSEGGAKPVGSGGLSVKTMTGKKVALIVPVSQEVAMSNAAGLYSQLRQDLPTAIARAFDHAAIHGVDLRTGAAGPFADYLKEGATSVELGTANQATGGIYADLVNGEAAVVNAGFDFTGFAADPRLRPTLKLSVDSTGRPLWVDNPQNGLRSGDLIGYPAYFNRGVSGFYRRHGHRVQTATVTGTPTGGTYTLVGSNGSVTGTIAYNATAATVQTAIRTLGDDYSAATVSGSAGGPYTITLNPGASGPEPLALGTNSLTGGTAPSVTIAATAPAGTTLRAIGGDWSQCAYGVGMDISIKVSTEASYVDEAGNTVSAFQNNLVLLLVEAYYGFVKSDAQDAWVAYVDAA
jgi:hypothetical protein